MHAIEIAGVTKSFGDVHVLKGVNLTVQPGEIFTLLGENGAGKSTLINILATLSKPDAGSVRVFGLDPMKQGAKVRERISLNAQQATVDAEFSGRQNLRLIAQLRGLNDIDAAIDKVAQQLDLSAFLNRAVKTYSGGMQRRLDLAMSMLGDPQLVFLDEPTTGVDPKNRLALWQMITQMRDAGKTVFLTTQYLDEADALSDHIAFIRDGVIVKFGTPKQIKQQVDATYTLTVDLAQFDAAQTAMADDHVAFDVVDEAFSLNAADAPNALTTMVDAGITVVDYHRNQANLETVFLAVNAEGQNAND